MSKIELEDMPLLDLVRAIRELANVQANTDADRLFRELEKRCALCRRFKSTEATYVRDMLGIPHE